MKRQIYFFVAIQSLCLFSPAAHAADTISIRNLGEVDSLTLIHHASYWLDEKNRVKWPEISHQLFTTRQPTPWQKPDYENYKNTIWLKWIIKNEMADSIPLLIVFYRNAFFKELIVERNHDTSRYQPNYFFSPVSKVKRKNVSIAIAPGESMTLWLRAADPYGNLFEENIYLTTTQHYQQFLDRIFDKAYSTNIFKLIFLAIVAFITAHTLAQYFIRRRREFIFYAFYSTSVFLLFLQQLEMSLSYDFVFSFFPYVQRYSNILLSILVYYTYLRFARQFVDFSAFVPWFYKTIIWTERFLVFMAVADIFCSVQGRYTIAGELFFIDRVVVLLVSFIGIFILLSAGKKVLYFFAIGSLLLVIGSLLAMIYTFFPGQSPVFRDDAMRYMQIGIILELLCFTSGLSYKSSLIEVEKQRTQQQLIGQLEENRRLQEELNVHLEERVQEQTVKIIAQQKQLEKEKQDQLTVEFKKKLTEMELQVLKAQLNPHFYFNTLNNLYGLTIIDPKKAPDAILKLSDIMEYIIYDCKNEKVLLGKELKFISSYIELERLRYEDNASISLHVTGGGDGQFISPLLLIQFVENAFKHGMEQNKTNSYMQVDISVDNGLLFFKAINSVRQKPGSNHGLGLSNVQKRLQMLYPGKHHLLIDRSANEFTVELQLELS